MANFIKIHEDDNVAVALENIPQNVELEVAGEKITTQMEIPAGHKFALKELPTGTAVIKYGFRIGNTTADVEAGEWIHTHNLKTGLGDLLDYTYEPNLPEEKITEDVTLMVKSVYVMRFGSFQQLDVSIMLPAKLQTFLKIWYVRILKQYVLFHILMVVPRWEMIRKIQDRFLPI